MKKLMMYTMAFLFAVTLSMAGTSNAGFFGSDSKTKTNNDAATSTEQTMHAGKQLTLSGTVDQNSRFIDDKGQIYNLADNDKGMEVKALSGQKIEIKGTVMEDAGRKTVEVQEYNLIK